LGDDLLAVDDFARVIALRPKSGSGYAYRGREWVKLRDYRRAQEDLDHALQLNVKDAWSYSARADLFDQEGKRLLALADLNRAISLSPDAWSYANRGKIKSDLGQKQQSILDFNQAIKLDPRQPDAYSWRAHTLAELGDKIGATKDFRTATKLDPKYASFFHWRQLGAQNDETNVLDKGVLKDRLKSVSNADLAFGEKQLRCMISDRKRMARFVSVGDPVWTWTARQFAGEGIGAKICWNNNEPVDALAENQGPTDHHGTGEISIRETDGEGKLRDGEEQWSSAIFELFNIRNTPQFDKAWADIAIKNISKEEYIRQMTKLEFKAELKETWFYRTIWVPHAIENDLPSTGYYWADHGPDTYKEWIAQYNDHSSYPYHCYGIAYDKMREWIRETKDAAAIGKQPQNTTHRH
jgi:hypothetical protein